MARILICGSVAYDRIMVFPGYFRDHFLPEGLHNINVSFSVGAPKEQFGGTAGNIAYNLTLLEEKPAICATAGNDFVQYNDWLIERDIDTSGIEICEDVPTASAYIVNDQADNQITAFSTAADGRPYKKEPDLSEVSLACISPTGTDKMTACAAQFKEAGIAYLVDPGQQIPSLSAKELQGMIDGATILIVNDYELALITEKTGWNEAELAKRANVLVVTLGADGSRIVTNEEEIAIAAVPAKKVADPTGAGDAYRAGFMRGYAAELPLNTCAQIGSAVAAYAVEWYGTQNHRFTLAELRERYTAVYKEPFPF